MLSTNNVKYALAVIFLISGIAKLAGLELLIIYFRMWGYPEWFMYVCGAIEFLGAIALFMPRFTTVAAACLAVFMVGAAGTHLINLEMPMASISAGIMLAAVWLAWEGIKNQ